MHDINLAKLAAYKKRQEASIYWLKDRLRSWIEEHDDLPPGVSDPAASRNSVEITSALLETAIDRQIELHGPADALDLIERCFRRRVETFKRSLQ